MPKGAGTESDELPHDGEERLWMEEPLPHYGEEQLHRAEEIFQGCEERLHRAEEVFQGCEERLYGVGETPQGSNILSQSVERSFGNAAFFCTLRRQMRR